MSTVRNFQGFSETACDILASLQPGAHACEGAVQALRQQACSMSAKDTLSSRFREFCDERFQGIASQFYSLDAQNKAVRLLYEVGMMAYAVSRILELGGCRENFSCDRSSSYYLRDLNIIKDLPAVPPANGVVALANKAARARNQPELDTKQYQKKFAHWTYKLVVNPASAPEVVAGLIAGRREVLPTRNAPDVESIYGKNFTIAKGGLGIEELQCGLLAIRDHERPFIAVHIALDLIDVCLRQRYRTVKLLIP